MMTLKTSENKLLVDSKQFQQQLAEDLGANSDLITRVFTIDEKSELVIAYIESICDIHVIQSTIVKPINELFEHSSVENLKQHHELVQHLRNYSLSAARIQTIDSWSEVLDALVSGNTVIFVPKSPEVIVVGTKSIESRSVTEPTTQVLVRGPKDGFTEMLQTNIALIRSRIQSSKLKVELSKLGTTTQTDIAVTYIDGVVDQSILESVKKKLADIKIDGVLESRYLESFLEGEEYSPFPLTCTTERPDVIVGNLLEGRIIILINGTPFAIILPTLFMDFFKTAEDYYEKADISSMVRLIRIFAFVLSLVTPGLYVALVTHHIGMIPTGLAISIAAQREGVPFPTIVEIFLLDITFEILREAGIRIPRASGQAASIVGALIIGQGVVEAGFVSAISTIIVALTAISSFAVPQYDIGGSARMLRFVMLVMGAFIGLYGIILTLFVIVFHLAKLSSFGVPYFSPISPFNAVAQQDNFIRLPWKMMKRKRNVVRDKK